MYRDKVDLWTFRALDMGEWRGNESDLMGTRFVSEINKNVQKLHSGYGCITL